MFRLDKLHFLTAAFQLYKQDNYFWCLKCFIMNEALRGWVFRPNTHSVAWQVLPPTGDQNRVWGSKIFFKSKTKIKLNDSSFRTKTPKSDLWYCFSFILFQARIVQPTNCSHLRVVYNFCKDFPSLLSFSIGGGILMINYRFFQIPKQ